MGKFDDFDLDIKRSGNNVIKVMGVGGSITCISACSECLSQNSCPSQNTCSDCHSYCGSACQR